jgi:hypothetical protein
MRQNRCKHGRQETSGCAYRRLRRKSLTARSRSRLRGVPCQIRGADRLTSVRQHASSLSRARTPEGARRGGRAGGGKGPPNGVNGRVPGDE